MNLRLCFEGLKNTKTEQIDYLKSKLSTLNPEARNYDPSMGSQLNQAILDLESLSGKDFQTYFEVARDDVFYDCTELGHDYY
jgi:hypothetical protein